jgi:hypothetical protein
LAIVVSEDLITQLAVEQLVEEASEQKIFSTQFFDNEAAVRGWLIAL